jgi:hypothetical protein
MTSAQLPLPKDSDDPIRLADWLEVYALVSGDGNSSAGDLERAIHRPGLDTSRDPNELCAEVFAELELRATAARHSYPFQIQGAVVSLRGGDDLFAPYLFCLCLSYFGWQQKKASTVFPRRMFEDLAALAAKNFVKGDSYRFAAPRKDVPQFRDALDRLCGRMGEGAYCKLEDTRSAQDDNLDIVAWSHFPDRNPGKLLLFGQCATGEDWQGVKLMSLQPREFCMYWLHEVPPSPLIRAYFIPHRVSPRDWNRSTTFGGIIFDRCRISYWTHSGKRLKVTQPYVDWVKSVVAALQ